jgi:hypothetical protein
MNTPGARTGVPTFQTAPIPNNATHTGRRYPYRALASPNSFEQFVSDCFCRRNVKGAPSRLVELAGAGEYAKAVPEESPERRRRKATVCGSPRNPKSSGAPVSTIQRILSVRTPTLPLLYWLTARG